MAFPASHRSCSTFGTRGVLGNEKSDVTKVDNDRKCNQAGNVLSCSLRQIANWWLRPDDNSEIKVSLPPLQRGFVWRPEQVARLWDSIIRGFPIGSLLLAPRQHDDDSKPAQGHGQSLPANRKPPTYWLLDGQQRVTSIALGFRDFLDSPADTCTEALWIDLKPEAAGEGVPFGLVTRAHPWGYRRDKLGERLSAADIRQAVEHFSEKNETGKPSKWRINKVFPWKLAAPMPLFMVLEAAEKHPAPEGMSECLKDAAKAKLEYLLGERMEEVIKVLEQGSCRGLLKRLRRAVIEYRIPALKSQHDLVKPEKEEKPSGAVEPLGLLFERINAGGTALSQEEIAYSQLKAIWPEARTIIEDELLRKIGHLARPARMAMLLLRVGQWIHQGHQDPGEANAMPLGVPSINDVRRLMGKPGVAASEQSARGEDKDDRAKPFGDWIRDWLESAEGAEALLEDAWALLVYRSDQEHTMHEGDCGLPRVLAAELTGGNFDLMVIFLYWLHLLRDNGGKPPKADSQRRCRTLGALTAIHWFGGGESSLIRVRDELLRIKGQGHSSDLPDFWNSDLFNRLVLQENDKSTVLVLPPPDLFAQALMAPLETPRQGAPEGLLKTLADDPESDSLNVSLYSLYGPDGDLEASVKEYIKAKLQRDDEVAARAMWWKVCQRVLEDRGRRLICFAQRKFIETHYDWFDPTQPKSIQDRNRPWDYDHILPHAWTHDGRGLRGSIPELVRAWVNTSGNLRAWPMEANRSKRDARVLEEKLDPYDLYNPQLVARASFARCKRWRDLENATPGTEERREFWGVHRNSKEMPKGRHYRLFVEAVVERTVDLYRHWYEMLRIGELMGEGDNERASG